MAEGKPKLTLDEMRESDFFVSVEQPKIVYHMTPRENVSSILRDGRIKTFDDYLCFFFPELKQIPIYIKMTGALIGRDHWSYDHVVREAPLDVKNTVVLVLEPLKEEPHKWFKESTYEMALKRGFAIEREDGTVETVRDRKLLDKLLEDQKAFDDARICHYKNFRFKDNPEIIELEKVLEMYPID